MDKRCFKCGDTKPRSEFYKHSKMADGLLGKCKECTKRDVADRYKTPEGRNRCVAYELVRSKDPERRRKALEYQRRRRAVFPEKNIARQAVANALRAGRIERKPCERCGDNRTQAHHPDYSKPLDVKWLCFRCHREGEHGQKVGLVPISLGISKDPR